MWTVYYKLYIVKHFQLELGQTLHTQMLRYQLNSKRVVQESSCEVVMLFMVTWKYVDT